MGIKEEILDLYNVIRNLDPDTVPIRIVNNRDKLRPYLAKARGLDISLCTPTQKLELKELIRLLQEYYRYFDVGYQSTEIIDNLPDKIKTQMEKLIEII